MGDVDGAWVLGIAVDGAPVLGISVDGLSETDGDSVPTIGDLVGFGVGDALGLNEGSWLGLDDGA